MDIRQFNNIKKKAKRSGKTFTDTALSMQDAYVSSSKELYNYLLKAQNLYDEFSKRFAETDYNNYDKQVVELRKKLDAILNDEYIIKSNQGNLEGKFKIYINGGEAHLNYFDNKTGRVIYQYTDRVNMSSLNEFIRKCFAHYSENKETPTLKDMKFLYYLYDSGESGDRLITKWNGVKIDTSKIEQLKRDILQADRNHKKDGTYDKTDLSIVFYANGKKYRSKLDRIDIGDGEQAMKQYFRYLDPNYALQTAERYINSYGLGSSGLVRKLDSIKTRDRLDESEKNVVEDAIYWVKKEGKPLTIANVIAQINEDMSGFLGANKDRVIDYLRNEKHIKDSKKARDLEVDPNWDKKELVVNQKDKEFFEKVYPQIVEAFIKHYGRKPNDDELKAIRSMAHTGTGFAKVIRTIYGKDSIKDGLLVDLMHLIQEIDGSRNKTAYTTNEEMVQAIQRHREKFPYKVKITKEGDKYKIAVIDSIRDHKIKDVKLRISFDNNADTNRAVEFLKSKNVKADMVFDTTIDAYFNETKDWNCLEILKSRYNITKQVILLDSVKDIYPREDESKTDFIARFMNETKNEYPDEKQRYAVANSYWEKKGRDSLQDSIRDFFNVKDRLVDPPIEVQNEFENGLKNLGFRIDKKGKTYFDNIHWQVTYLKNDLTPEQVARKLWDYERVIENKYHTPLTSSIGTDYSGNITAGIDMREMYVKDSITDSFKYNKGDLKVGQEVIYNGYKTKILDLEWDDNYGYDVLIEKENGDKIWVGEQVQKI